MAESKTDRQDELLAREDGRYFAIDKFNTGLGSIATTERLKGKIVSFGLPSGPALFLHLAKSAYDKTENLDPFVFFQDHPGQGRRPDNQGPLFDFFEQVSAHIIFSFTALEAFANEVIPQGFKYEFEERSGSKITLEKDDIERRVNLDEKLGKVLPLVCSTKSPKGLGVWANYRKLKKLRDRLIHLKSNDRKSSGPDIETIWGQMLENYKVPFCDYAHQMMGHFGPTIRNRRWYKQYPY